MSGAPPKQSAPSRIVLLNPEQKDIHAPIGQAIDAYAHLEGSISMVLEALLGTSAAMASTVFFAVQNVRSRHEMIQSMMNLVHGNKYDAYWAKCAAFLQNLAKFRNALVHWQPRLTLYTTKTLKISRTAHELGAPTTAGSESFLNIRAQDIPPFINDCRYIQQEIYALVHALNGGAPPAASPDKFLKPAIRPNLASLRPRPTPRAQKPRPQSSPASGRQKGSRTLSAKQRRLRALKMAEKKKGAKGAPSQP
jgi:hypothetical protein